MESRLVSPNDMLEAAKRIQLDGRDPNSVRDWEEVMNFVAANVAVGFEKEVCKLFVIIYDIPLPAAAVELIAEFQAATKDKSNSKGVN